MTQNSEKNVLHDENGKFIKGHPKIGGIQLGEKHPISVIGNITQMFEKDPEKFQEFIDKYLKDPKNRQHIVDKIDGKPAGSETNVAIQVNNYQVTPEDKEAWAVKYLEELGYKLTKE